MASAETNTSVTTAEAPTIAMFVATRRGLLVLQQVMRLQPAASFIVFSFKESPEEPPFLASIQEVVNEHPRATMYITTKVDSDLYRQKVWDNAEVHIDLALVVSWRYLIPSSVYKVPKCGTYVFHDSYLPVYRGFAPTPWAIINGESYTGASLMLIGENVDEGPLVGQEKIPIEPLATIKDVMEQVTNVYICLVTRHLERLLDSSNPIELTEQDHSLATFTCKRLPTDNWIDFNWPTHRIHNMIRASTVPYPGAFCTIRETGRTLKIWDAVPVENPLSYVGRIPGRVARFGPDGVVVITGDGEILIKVVSFEGEDEKKPANTVLNKLALTLVDPRPYMHS